MHLRSINAQNTPFVIPVDDVIASHDLLGCLFNICSVPKALNCIDHLGFSVPVIVLVGWVVDIKVSLVVVC